MGLDSYAGVSSEETQKNIQKAGSASREHPVAALLNASYASTVKTFFYSLPMAMVVVNHLDIKKDDMGREVRTTKGGRSIKFQEVLEIHLSSHKRFETANFGGSKVDLILGKSSFSPASRRIQTRVIDWVEEDPSLGRPVKNFIWDWDWSLCDLLYKLQEKPSEEKKALADRGFAVKASSPTAHVDCRIHVPALGMSRDETLPYSEAGRLIHESPELSNKVRDALFISRKKPLTNLDDMLKEFSEDVK
jgi:hypothetical protein